MSLIDSELQNLLSAGIEARCWPGAVLGLVTGSGKGSQVAQGHHTYERCRAMACDTLFDLASLTKVVGTTTLAMRLVDAGVMHLDRPVCEALPDFLAGVPTQASWRGRVSARHLLAHASGLPAYVPLHKREGLRGKAFWDAVMRIPLESAPTTETRYSDIGFMILGRLVSHIAGLPLDELVLTQLCAPLGLADTRYCPPGNWRERIAPTEKKDGMTGFVHGVVHDENARAAGGVSGHAGLFSTVSDLCGFARMMLRGGVLDSRAFVRDAIWQEFTRPGAVVEGSTRCLGWDSPSPSCSGGRHLHAGSFGHTGFTGTSMWIDPDADLAVVLLTNAVHPHRDCRQENGFFQRRREVHSAVYELLGKQPPSADSA